MYINAYHDRDHDKILVVGRDKDHKRFFETFDADYSFYYEDVLGKYQSIYGDKLSKVECYSYQGLQRELKFVGHKKLFESDTRPVFRTLEDNYLKADLPHLNTAPIDIETGFCKRRGFASPDDPHQPITAISLNLDWKDQLITLALRPPELSSAEVAKVEEAFSDCYVFDDERDLLKTFLDLIEDIDVLYTWNGEGFDIPYIVNRIIKTIGKEYTRKLCMWDMFPRKRTFERYGKEQNTFDLIGRIHLDYLQLYRKYTYHEMPTYRLDAIGEYELKERKIQYDGTLDQLYNKDFYKFVEYNRQDVKLLTKLDEKLKFINLTNLIAHENCVLFDTTMGAVGLTDQAIILEAHSKNMIVPNRVKQTSGTQIAGAFVADPVVGISEWVSSVDINSLYPSAIRTLNMSPETIVGQLRQNLTTEYFKMKFASGDEDEDLDDVDLEDESAADKWRGLFASLEYTEVMEKTDTIITIDLDDGASTKLPAKEVYDWIFAEGSNLCLTANGTIFRTDIEGLIPGLLSRWYNDRQMMQGKMKEFENKILSAEGDAEKKKEYTYWKNYWDVKQHIQKIALNSLYGAVTNAGSRFFDQRIGQSTTLSGRTITKHMISKISELLIGDYNHESEVIVYGDTDSCYFSLKPIVEELQKSGTILDKDLAITISNQLGEDVNTSFKEFVMKAFNVPERTSGVIKCSRELCATHALFIKKKKYAMLYFDKDGKRKDMNGTSGELKIMGLETQRADTPEPIQIFLKDVLRKVLEGASEHEIVSFVRGFREKVKELKPWEKGTPKRVNKLTYYENEMLSKKKVTVPGHVRASVNWNTLKKLNNDSYSMTIMDGQKVIVCKLKPNPLGYTSVAYPIDEFNLPPWFLELPFDSAAMEEGLLDKKLENIIGVLKWDLEISKMNSAFVGIFELED